MEAVALVALLMVVVVKAFTVHRLNMLEAQIRTIQAEEAEVSDRLHETESIYRQLEQESKGLDQEIKHLENDRDLASLEITKLGGNPITLEQLEEQLAPKPQPSKPAPPASSESASESAPPTPETASQDTSAESTADAPEASGRTASPAAPSQGAPQSPSPDEPESSRQRILVVDDNNELRGLLLQALSSEFEVVEAPDGFEALTKILKEKQVYDLIITDLKMPKLNGITLVQNLPDATPVIIISGYIDSPEFKKGLSDLSSVIVLKKPFKVSTLRNATHKALSQEPAS